MFNTIEHDIWLFSGTRGTPGGHLGAHPDPSPGDTWLTRRASGGSPGSLARGHVAHPEGIRGLAQIPRPGTRGAPGEHPAEHSAEVLFTRASVAPVVLFTQLKVLFTRVCYCSPGQVLPRWYCSSEQVLLPSRYPGRYCSPE